MQPDTLIGKAPNHRERIKYRFTGGINDSEVWLYKIVGGGHTWAWDDMDTDEKLWKFFSRFIKPWVYLLFLTIYGYVVF